MRKVAAKTKNAFRVLVIDDDENDREITGRHLGKAWPFEHELTLDYASDGDEALRKTRQTRYALFIVDWKLPDTSGVDMLRNLRQLGMNAPVIVVSGLQRHQIPENIEALGATFLNKDDMNAITLHDAVADSLRLLGHETPSETSSSTT